MLVHGKDDDYLLIIIFEWILLAPAQIKVYVYYIPKWKHFHWAKRGKKKYQKLRYAINEFTNCVILFKKFDHVTQPNYLGLKWQIRKMFLFFGYIYRMVVNRTFQFNMICIENRYGYLHVRWHLNFTQSNIWKSTILCISLFNWPICLRKFSFS